MGGTDRRLIDMIVMPDKGSPRIPRKTHVVHVPHMEFIDSSPDYCRRDVKFGTLGTTNRTCMKEPGEGSCRDICCQGWRMRCVNKTFYTNCRFEKLLKLKCKKEVKRRKQ